MASTNDLPPDDAALLAVVYLMTAVAEPPQAPLPQPLPPKRLARLAERVLESMSTLFLEAFIQDPSRSSGQIFSELTDLYFPQNVAGASGSTHIGAVELHNSSEEATTSPILGAYQSEAHKDARNEGFRPSDLCGASESDDDINSRTIAEISEEDLFQDAPDIDNSAAIHVSHGRRTSLPSKIKEVEVLQMCGACKAPKSRCHCVEELRDDRQREEPSVRTKPLVGLKNIGSPGYTSLKTRQASKAESGTATNSFMTTHTQEMKSNVLRMRSSKTSEIKTRRSTPSGKEILMALGARQQLQRELEQDDRHRQQVGFERHLTEARSGDVGDSKNDAPGAPREGSDPSLASSRGERMTTDQKPNMNHPDTPKPSPKRSYHTGKGISRDIILVSSDSDEPLMRSAKRSRRMSTGSNSTVKRLVSRSKKMTARIRTIGERSATPARGVPSKDIGRSMRI